jgi:hypothetical protein
LRQPTGTTLRFPLDVPALGAISKPAIAKAANGVSRAAVQIDLKAGNVATLTQLSGASASLLGGLKVVTAPASLIVATAPYATPVLNGTPLVTLEDFPKTSLWFFLYAQTVQADGSSMRNVLLASAEGVYLSPRRSDTLDATVAPIFKNYLSGSATHQRDRIGFAVFTQAEVETILQALHLSTASPLSILAVELLPAGTGTEVGPPPGALEARTLAVAATQRGGVFPFGRILRSSPLTPIAAVC